MSLLSTGSPLLPALRRSVDGVAIAAALYGVVLWLDRDWNADLAGAAAAAALAFLAIAEMRHLYGSWRLQPVNQEFGIVVSSWAMACATLVTLAFLLDVSSADSRPAMIVWFLSAPAALLLPRMAARAVLGRLRRGGANTRAVAIAGCSRLGGGVLRRLEETSHSGLRIAGVFDDDAVVEGARRGELDYVLIALPMREEARIAGLVNRLADTTASVYIVPDLFVFDLMQARPVSLQGLPAISVYESPFDGLSGWVKRAEDLVIGSLLLVIAAIPMVVVGLALKLGGNGSVFFRQKRYGLSGRIVRIWKFRTMTVSEDGSDVVQVRRHDPRVTPIGRILRATSLDELPQLFNVLSGEMSVVGPRPHAVAVNEEYRPLVHGYMLRHKVKPGITGWAQVNGWHGDDSVEKMQKRLEHDLAYLRDWSLWLDLKIVALTLLAVLSRTKAR